MDQVKWPSKPRVIFVYLALDWPEFQCLHCDPCDSSMNNNTGPCRRSQGCMIIEYAWMNFSCSHWLYGNSPHQTHTSSANYFFVTGPVAIVCNGEVGLKQKCIPKPSHENWEKDFGSKASGRVKIVTRVHFLQNTPNIAVCSWSPGDSSALLAAHEIEYTLPSVLAKMAMKFPFSGLKTEMYFPSSSQLRFYKLRVYKKNNK